MRVNEVSNQILTCVPYHVRNLFAATCLKACRLGFLLMLTGIDSMMHITPHILMYLWMKYPVNN